MRRIDELNIDATLMAEISALSAQEVMTDAEADEMGKTLLGAMVRPQLEGVFVPTGDTQQKRAA